MEAEIKFREMKKAIAFKTPPEDGEDEFFLRLQNWVIAQMPNLEFTEGVQFEYENFKSEECDPIEINGIEIYPKDCTIEMYLFWYLGLEVEILQEDLIIEATYFEEMTQ